MKNPLTCSGEIEYIGDLENLLHRIIQMDGVLVTDQKFTCVLYIPDHAKVISPIRGRLSVRFRCRYEESKHGFKILYRAYPTARYYIPTALMLILMIVCFCCGFQSATCLWGAIVCALLLIIFTVVFFAVRTACVKRFCDVLSH